MKYFRIEFNLRGVQMTIDRLILMKELADILGLGKAL